MHRYILPYDFGLSASRNYLAAQAYKLGLKYCLVTADSILFTNKYNLAPFIKFLELSPFYAVLGFKLRNRQDFTYDLEISDELEKFLLIKPRREPIIHEGLTIQPCDIVKNFFLVKTEVLMQVPWNNDLKLCEHEDWFYRLKIEGLKTFYTEAIEAEYIDDKPAEYLKMRNRMYDEYASKLKSLYRFTKPGGWIAYQHKLRKEQYE